ncbi:hypothetical protein E0L93_02245 [Rubrobacter taiwanensis]|jgi:hypothetical protein|uniref:Yip1 domain-containing protein n=1 Tax=Rubrobacter taiwanensis TaxID=185139 RepID=A0A4R1BQ50_9ACTN|nr:YIP1 family protein [Rubrobacter taiwanensis]TCJ19800.1 hypothetical protein E0L93_02245 [Rubrobacter taiwanensis]
MPEKVHSPEFDGGRPLESAAAVLRELFLRPRRFFLNFSPEGEVRDPALFVMLVTAVAAVTGLVLSILGPALGLGERGTFWILLLQAAGFVVLSPLLVAAAAACYWLSIRTFVGPVTDFRQVYRILAHAYGPMILFGIPGVGALAFGYGAMALMVLAVRGVYRTSLMTALITALVGFVPVATALMFFYLVLAGWAHG